MGRGAEWKGGLWATRTDDARDGGAHGNGDEHGVLGRARHLGPDSGQERLRLLTSPVERGGRLLHGLLDIRSACCNGRAHTRQTNQGQQH